MIHGSLFSGTGGFDKAADWMGWTNAFHCEIDTYCRKILRQHWPNATSYDDISTTDFTQYRGGIDILTGGDPCQPHSVAGNRAGEFDARFLWPHFVRAAVETRCYFLLNENVPGSISNGTLDRKVSDLESIGYTCWPPLLIPAGAGKAIHRRDRVWLVAYDSSKRRKECNAPSFTESQAQRNVWDDTKRALAYGDGAWTPDKSTILRMADGLPDRPHRNKRIKAMGNAIDPRIAYQLFRTVELYDLLY